MQNRCERANTHRDLKTRWEEVTPGEVVDGRSGIFRHDGHKSKFVDPERVSETR